MKEIIVKWAAAFTNITCIFPLSSSTKANQPATTHSLASPDSAKPEYEKGINKVVIVDVAYLSPAGIK